MTTLLTSAVSAAEYANHWARWERQRDHAILVEPPELVDADWALGWE